MIQEQVGKGSVGRVYRATHRAMNRTVAIKVMSSDLMRTSAAKQAFQREVRAAARLNHPNIVTAYDANEVGDRFYLVLEFVDGPTLEALVRARGPLPWPEACELAQQVALGLQHAHEQGMVHRDIKPANLLVTRPSRTLPGCIVKIADFGIAKLTPVSNLAPTADAGLTGTPDYIAPEQAFNPRLADPRSDLYALGGVLYFLLAGRPPFPGGTAEEKVRRHQSEAPAPIQSLRPDVSPALAGLVARLLAKDPNHRPPTAADAAARLQSLLPGGDARIDFDLPPVNPGQPSFASGSLATSETSPWAQLTDEMVECGGTLSGSLEETPFFPPAYRKRSARRGLPGFVVLAMCAGVAAGCLLGLSLLLKLVGK